MPYVLIRHKVANYAKWKPAYSEHKATRKASGSKGARLFRNVNDRNEMVILFRWENLKKARQFAQSEDLRQKMQEAGVADQPDIYFLEEVERTSA